MALGASADKLQGVHFCQCRVKSDLVVGFVIAGRSCPGTAGTSNVGKSILIFKSFQAKFRSIV